MKNYSNNLLKIQFIKDKNKAFLFKKKHQNMFKRAYDALSKIQVFLPIYLFIGSPKW